MISDEPIVYIIVLNWFIVLLMVTYSLVSCFVELFCSPFVCLLTFHIFNFFSRTALPNSTKLGYWYKSFLGKGDSSLFKWRQTCLLFCFHRIPYGRKAKNTCYGRRWLNCGNKKNRGFLGVQIPNCKCCVVRFESAKRLI